MDTNPNGSARVSRVLPKRLLVFVSGLFLLLLAAAVFLGWRYMKLNSGKETSQPVAKTGDVATGTTSGMQSKWTSPSYHSGKDPAVKYQLLNALRITDVDYRTIDAGGETVDVADVTFEMVQGVNKKSFTTSFVKEVRVSRPVSPADGESGFGKFSTEPLKQVGWKKDMIANVGFYYVDEGKQATGEEISGECSEVYCSVYITLGFGKAPVANAQGYIQSVLDEEGFSGKLGWEKVVPAFIYLLSN